MVEIPELGDVQDTVEETGRNLIPWLPDPFTCPECNVYCYTSMTWDPHMVEYTESWECRECGQHYRRDE